MNSINSNFTEVSRDINEISVRFIENVVNYGNENELNQYLLATELRDVLTTKIITSNSKDGLFVLKPEDGLSLVQFSNRILADERAHLTDLFNSKSVFDDINTNGRWSIIKIHEHNYVVKVLWL